MELKSLYIKFHLCLNFKWNLENFLKSNLFSLITISMNWFDQLVIVICDPVMK